MGYRLKYLLLEIALKHNLAMAITRKIPRRFGVSLILIASVLLVASGFQYWSRSSKIWYGYVVGDDRRIYMVNLDSGTLEWSSDRIDGIRIPSEIDIDTKESILYVASQSFLPRTDFSPLMAVDLKKNADVIYSSWIYPDFEIGSYSPSIFYLRLNPNSDVLYVALGDPEFERRIELDASNATITGQNDIFIRKRDDFSDDGTKLAQIYPGIQRITEEGVQDVPGVIIVWDLETGEQILRTTHENNQNLYPPWGSADEHFVFVRWEPRNDIFDLEVYERESGEQLASYSLLETFRLYPRQFQVTHIPESEYVAMTMDSYIVVFNPLTAEIISKTHVANVGLSEVVVADKPPIIE